MKRNSDTRQKLLVVAAIFGSAMVLAIAAAAVTSRPITADLVLAVLLLGSLAAVATYMDVDVDAAIGLSGNTMILIAAIVVFRPEQFYLGVALVAVIGALDYIQVRRRELYKMVINAGIDCLVLLAASAVYWTTAPAGSALVPNLAAAALGAGVFYLLHCTLLSWPLAITRGEKYRTMLRQLMVIELRAYPFSLVGLGVGWVYIHLGAAVVPLFAVPIFVARRTFASFVELKAAQEQTIETLITALEAKDRYTAGHAQRVALFCAYVGEELHFNPRRMERLRYAALMHDIGKLIVPNQLLNKPGRLTESEFERVKRHEFVSVELLRRIDFLAPIAGDTTTEAATAAVSGGLVEPAIIHVADAFDAMTSTRSYRRALPQATAFDELRRGAGSQFNEGCVEALIDSIERRGEHYGDGHEEDIHEWDVAPPEAGTGSAGLGDLAEERTI
jgi:HD-GYP domain-containing protein (c-di-GMP phosphodiesterase class II)